MTDGIESLATKRVAVGGAGRATQGEPRSAAEEDRSFVRDTRRPGAPDDVALFYGAVWRCTMPDRADLGRNAVLNQDLPKWVTPMEDVPAALPRAVLDAAAAGNAESRA